MFNALRTYILMAAIAALPAAAQNYRAPRTAGGQPDMQGIWQADTTAYADLIPHAAQLGMPAGFGIVEGGAIPYKPEVAAKVQENFKHRATEDPVRHCFLPGVPRANYMPFPLQIFQTPEDVAILYEYVHAYRLVPLNGSKHPEDIDFWMGDSRGHWEGNTLVVDTTNFNSEYSFRGSDSNLHLIERFTRVSPDVIQYEFTVDDPTTFTKTWTARIPLNKTSERVYEYACHEGNYALADILAGARDAEKRAAGK